MNENVKKLFIAASKDNDFQVELSVHEKEYYKPSIFWDDKKRVIYATIYMGWLIGKRKYNESDFK